MHWVFDRSNFMNSLQKLPPLCSPSSELFISTAFFFTSLFPEMSPAPRLRQLHFFQSNGANITPNKVQDSYNNIHGQDPLYMKREEKDGAFLTTRLAKIQSKKSFACALKIILCCDFIKVSYWNLGVLKEKQPSMNPGWFTMKMTVALETS